MRSRARASLDSNQRIACAGTSLHQPCEPPVIDAAQRAGRDRPQNRGMRKLLAGIQRFRRKIFPKHALRFRKLALAQTPETLFISCSDSRVVPNLIAAADPGDLFAVRNIGNLVPPANAQGLSIGDLSEAGAIEYAV